MKDTKKYRIVARADGYIASRDIRFNGKTSVVVRADMTLREAHSMLLDMFNEDYDTSYPNWGLVRCHHRIESTTHHDGTRSYEWDSRYYRIEEDED